MYVKLVAGDFFINKNQLFYLDSGAAFTRLC